MSTFVNAIVGLNPKQALVMDDGATVGDVRYRVDAPSSMSATINGQPANDSDPLPTTEDDRAVNVIFALAAKNN